MKIKKRAAEINYTVLDSDTNCIQIFFETNERREDCATEKSQNLPLKVLLFKFKSHPHVDFIHWHLPNLHCEKWEQKIPEALWHLGFLLWHLFRMHNMVAGVGFEPHDLRVMSPTS